MSAEQPTVRTLTPEQARAELVQAIEVADERGWTVANLKAAGAAWELDADERWLLQRIENLEWLAGVQPTLDELRERRLRPPEPIDDLALVWPRIQPAQAFNQTEHEPKPNTHEESK